MTIWIWRAKRILSHQHIYRPRLLLLESRALPSLVAPLSYDTGSLPEAVAVGDFNGDGVADLVTANNSDTVSVLLGTGDGSFQPAHSFAAGVAPTSVAVGDFNGDGVADLAIASGVGVSVLLGTGDGSFQPALTFAAGPGPQAVVVDDFNGDGVPDLAVVFDGGVRVLLGNGDGTFQTSPVCYVAGSAPVAAAVGDFNGDGLPDLAVARSGKRGISILLNDGIWGSTRGTALGSLDRQRRRIIRALAGALIPPSNLPALVGSPVRYILPSPPPWVATSDNSLLKTPVNSFGDVAEPPMRPGAPFDSPRFLDIDLSELLDRPG